MFFCVSAGLSDSVHDDSLLTAKSVPSYCDVIDDNMASNCHHQLYRPQYHHHHHHHWTLAPPPPSYSSTNWDATPRPLQPSAPHVDSAHCDDVTVTSPCVTSRTHHVVDSAATIVNQDAMIHDSTIPATCPQCRRPTPACV